MLDWNAIAVSTFATASPSRPTPIGNVDMAVVQVVVFDAVQALNGKFKPYHAQIPGASGSPPHLPRRPLPFADEEAREQGRNVAKWATDTLRPLNN